MIIEKRVNSFTEDSQYDSSITGLSDGGYLVVWASYGPHLGIYSQRYDANNVKQGSEVTVSGTEWGAQPAVTTLNNGGYIITWKGVPSSPNVYADIYAQRFNANGIAQGSQFKVNTLPNDFQDRPSVTTLKNGDFVITWESTSYDNDNFDTDIHGQRFNANGVAKGTEFLVNINDTAEDQFWGPVTALSDGGFVVTWVSDYNVIHGQRYDADGVAKGSAFTIDSPKTLFSQGLSTAALNNGGFVVTWSSNGEIYGHRFDVNGIAVGTEFQINTYTDDTQLSSFVTTLSNGDFVVMWPSASQDSYISPYGDFGIYGQIFDANGVKKGGEFHVNTYIAGDQLDPKITALSDGGFAVTWSSEMNGFDQDVYVQRFDANGKITNDMHVSTAGNDVLTGSISDDDTVSYVNATAGVTVSLNLAGQQNTGGAGLDTLTGIEHLVGSAFGDKLTGNDKNNVLFGGSGNDTLAGWSGADTMVGGLGNDSYFVENANDVVIEKLNEGMDSVSSKVTFTLLENIENLTLTGTSIIDGTGNSQANTIIGNAAANKLSGGLGKDSLIGGAGNDTLNGDFDKDILMGGAGNDTLSGGQGNDILDGGTGNNILTGDGGNDIFKFTTKGHIDTITDYSLIDTIQLENAVFTALKVPGTLAANQFKIGSKALDSNDYVIYNNATGALLYDADGNGTGAAIQIAMIGSGLNMTNAEIVVI